MKTFDFLSFLKDMRLLSLTALGNWYTFPEFGAEVASSDFQSSQKEKRLLSLTALRNRYTFSEFGTELATG